MRKLMITNKLKQKQILEEISKEKKISEYSFLTKQELIERLYFRYDKRAVYYLVKQYNVSVENAIIYLDNMYYIEPKEYTSKKLVNLSMMKQELIDNGLLIYDSLFPFFLKKYTVLYDEACMTDFDDKIIEDIKKITEVTVLEEHARTTYIPRVYVFEKIDTEVEFIAREMISLYQSGILFQDMKLVGVHDEYTYKIKRIFNWYHIPVDLKEKKSIYSTVVVSEFLEQLSSGPTDEIIESLQEKFQTEQDKNILNQVIDIVNLYNWYDGDLLDMKEFFIYDFKNTYLSSTVFREMVQAITLEEVTDEDYVFFLGFNTDHVPVTIKDEEYITNAIVKELSCSTTYKKNKLKKMDMIKRIQSIKNLVITYKERGEKGDYYPSSLLSSIETKEITSMTSTVLDTSYSSIASKIYLGQLLDNYYKYGVNDENMPRLISTFHPFSYQKWSHTYTPIPSNLILDYFKEKNGLVLSYTNMDKYMKCGFYYYLDCILKLDEYQETFMTFIGNYYHYILEKIRIPSFDFEKETEEYMKDRTFTFKEKFLLEKLKEELKEVIKVVLYQESLSKHTTFYLEEKITVNYNYQVPVVMKGFIDKVMAYESDNRKYVSLIDYKTGGFDIGLDETMHGFHLQLPIYAYLIRHSDNLKDSALTGLYIAPILPGETLSKGIEDKLEKKIQDMRLVGYSNSDRSLLELFDSTYEDSRMIKGMKVTEKGFGPYSKVLSNEIIDSLVQLVEEKIKETITHIFKADFKVNPKFLKEKNISCKFCPYHDICYSDYKDYVYLKEEDYHTFLGGD